MKRTMRTGFVIYRIILANIAFDSLLLVSITAHFANPCCRRTESSSCMPIFTLDILRPIHFLYHCAWLFGFSALCIIAFPFPLDVQVLLSCFQSASSIAAKPVITIPLEHAAALLLHMGLNVLRCRADLSGTDSCTHWQDLSVSHLMSSDVVLTYQGQTAAHTGKTCQCLT